MNSNKNVKDITIFYPDVLKASKFSDAEIKNESPVSFETIDEDNCYRINVLFGSSKVIELASLFKTVYLELIDFIFLVDSMYKRFPKLTIQLLSNGKISYVCDDYHQLAYRFGYKQSICYLKKQNNLENPLDFFNKYSESDEEFIAALNVSKMNSIVPSPINYEKMCKSIYKELALGLYQNLGITINNYIIVNKENKTIYDSVLQSWRNVFFSRFIWF